MRFPPFSLSIYGADRNTKSLHVQAYPTEAYDKFVTQKSESGAAWSEDVKHFDAKFYRRTHKEVCTTAALCFIMIRSPFLLRNKKKEEHYITRERIWTNQSLSHCSSRTTLPMCHICSCTMAISDPILRPTLPFELSPTMPWVPPSWGLYDLAWMGMAISQC